MSFNLFRPATFTDNATRTWPWWLLVGSYYVACCLMHLRFSIWLVRTRDTAFGAHAYAEAIPWLATLAGIGLLAWLVCCLRHARRPGWLAGYWLLWATCVLLIDQFLTFSINEYAHYPQYALLAWLLARTMDPQRRCWYVGRVLFWTTLLGIGDELLQYLWITTSYSDYLDFNDFLTNLVAAAGGILIYYSSSNGPAPDGHCRRPVFETRTLAGIVVSLAIGFGSGRLAYSPTEQVPPGGIVWRADGSVTLYMQRSPDLYGSHPSGPRHGRYYVLPPVHALLLMGAVGLLFGSYRRVVGGKSYRN